MANTIDASFEEKWSKRMQSKHYRLDTFRDLANFEEQAVLKKGDKVHRPYRSNLSVNDMGAEGSYTRQDVSDTDENLTVDQEKEVSFYIKEIDEIQSSYDLMNKWADDAARALSNGIDGAFQAEVANANAVVDDADFGGTSANGFTLTEDNVYKPFTIASRKLDNTNSPQEGRFACLSPEYCSVLEDYLTQRETPWGDKVGERGYVGMFKGFAIYKTLAAYSTYVLSLVTQPTDGDTVTLNIPNNEGTRTTITFTFKTTLGSTAGNVLIGGSADVARANLVGLINTPGTTDLNGVALSATNQALLKNVTAINDNTADTLTLNATGKGYVVVGKTLTDATDTWTPAKQLQHQMFGVKGAIDLVIQVAPRLRLNPRDGFIGRDVVSWNIFGKKTFAEGARRLVDVKIRADQFRTS